MDLIAEFRQMVPAIRKKPGCVSYELTSPLETRLPGQLPFDPDDIAIVEVWRDWESFTQHITSEEYRGWYIGIYGLITRACMQVFESV